MVKPWMVATSAPGHDPGSAADKSGHNHYQHGLMVTFVAGARGVFGQSTAGWADRVNGGDSPSASSALR
jgi:hypothetical protein